MAQTYPPSIRRCVFCNSPNHWTYQHARDGTIRDENNPGLSASEELPARPSLTVNPMDRRKRGRAPIRPKGATELDGRTDPEETQT